jgi:hypothetical protein
LKVLRFLAVFLAVSVIVTVAAITASFVFWSFLSVQPGTVTALATLFLVAPGIGIAAGLWMAINGVRRQTGDQFSGAGEKEYGGRGLRAGLAALVGGFAGYGACKAAIDLTYTDRWSDPLSAPAWLPIAPPLAGFGLAVFLALLVLLPGIRQGNGARRQKLR